MSARTIVSIALLAVVLNGASVSALPCGRGVGLQSALGPREVAVDDFDLVSREPLFRDKIIPAVRHGATRLVEKTKHQASKIYHDPGKYVDRVGGIAQGLSTVVGAFGPRELEDALLELREDELDQLENILARDTDLDELNEILAREPLFRDKVIPAVRQSATRVYEKTKEQASKIYADPRKYISRVGNGIRQGVNGAINGFRGGAPAGSASEPAPVPAARDLEEALLQLRSIELDEIADMIARDTWAAMDELD